MVYISDDYFLLFILLHEPVWMIMRVERLDLENRGYPDLIFYTNFIQQILIYMTIEYYASDKVTLLSDSFLI